MWVAKTDSFGCVIPGCQNVGVQEYEMGLQESLVVAPNPAHGSIAFELPLPAGYALVGEVSAVLLDAQGKLIAEEAVERNGNLLTHSFTHTPSFSLGLYFLHLKDQRKWLAGARVVVE